MVLPLLIGFRPSGRDDAYRLVSHGVNDKQESALYHSNNNVTVLAVFLAIIQSVDGEGILEHIACHFESDGMLSEVLNRLPFVPFEIDSAHIYWFSVV